MNSLQWDISGHPLDDKSAAICIETDGGLLINVSIQMAAVNMYSTKLICSETDVFNMFLPMLQLFFMHTSGNIRGLAAIAAKSLSGMT